MDASSTPTLLTHTCSKMLKKLTGLFADCLNVMLHCSTFYTFIPSFFPKCMCMPAAVWQVHCMFQLISQMACLPAIALMPAKWQFNFKSGASFCSTAPSLSLSLLLVDDRLLASVGQLDKQGPRKVELLVFCSLTFTRYCTECVDMSARRLPSKVTFSLAS